MSRQRILYKNLIASNERVAKVIREFRKSNKNTNKKRR